MSTNTIIPGRAEERLVDRVVEALAAEIALGSACRHSDKVSSNSVKGRKIGRRKAALTVCRRERSRQAFLANSGLLRAGVRALGADVARRLRAGRCEANDEGNS